MSRLTPEDKAVLHYWEKKDQKLREILYVFSREPWEIVPGSGFRLENIQAEQGAKAVVVYLGRAPHGEGYAELYAFRVFETGETPKVPKEEVAWLMVNNRGTQKTYVREEENGNLVWQEREE